MNITLGNSPDFLTLRNVMTMLIITEKNTRQTGRDKLQNGHGNKVALSSILFPLYLFKL